MPIRNSLERWGSLAKLFHWLVVLLVICQFVLAWLAHDLPPGMEKLTLLARHKSIGITILALATLRLLWRAANRTPVLPATMAGWEKFTARATHALLYVLLFAVPLAGWIMSSAKNFPVSWFGLVQLPDLVAPSEATFDVAHETHEILAFSLGVIAILHLLAALKHHFFNRDTVLKRMLPFARVPALLLLMLFAAGPGSDASAATPGAQTLEGSGATGTLRFRFSQAGATTDGAFGRFTTVLTTGDDGAPATLEVRVEVDSLDTQDKDRDSALRSKDLFDVRRFPAATFSAGRITRAADGGYVAHGKLTIRDATRDVALPFTLADGRLAGQLAIKRLDYGVGQGEWRATSMVADAVTILWSVRLAPAH